jgi:hypothetical protein
MSRIITRCVNLLFLLCCSGCVTARRFNEVNTRLAACSAEYQKLVTVAKQEIQRRQDSYDGCIKGTRPMVEELEHLRNYQLQEETEKERKKNKKKSEMESAAERAVQKTNRELADQERALMKATK